MKKLLILSALLLTSLTARAQTNISYRITVDGVNTSWSYDVAGTKKDQAKLVGLIYAYGVYTASLTTNDVALALGPWLKRQHQVLDADYAAQKQASDNAALAAKIQNLLLTNPDLLSNADLTSLNTIATKAP